MLNIRKKFLFGFATLYLVLHEYIVTFFNHRKIIAGMEDELAKPFALRLLEFRNKLEGINVTLENPFFQSLCGLFIKFIKNNPKALNFTSITVMDQQEKFEIIVQRAAGKTPTEMCTQLQGEKLELQQHIVGLEEVISQSKGCCMSCINWRYTQLGKGECGRLSVYTDEAFYCSLFDRKKD